MVVAECVPGAVGHLKRNVDKFAFRSKGRVVFGLARPVCTIGRDLVNPKVSLPISQAVGVKVSDSCLCPASGNASNAVACGHGLVFRQTNSMFATNTSRPTTTPFHSGKDSRRTRDRSNEPHRGAEQKGWNSLDSSVTFLRRFAAVPDARRLWKFPVPVQWSPS